MKNGGSFVPVPLLEQVGLLKHVDLELLQEGGHIPPRPRPAVLALSPPLQDLILHSVLNKRYKYNERDTQRKR